MSGTHTGAIDECIERTVVAQDALPIRFLGDVECDDVARCTKIGAHDAPTLGGEK
jgi:hypothetical protein